MDQDQASPDPFRTFITHLLGQYGEAATGGGASPMAAGGASVQAPQHWVSQSVNPQEHNRSIRVTLPKRYCEDAGVDTDDPPSVVVYYDPATSIAMFDLADVFGGDRHG